jgi:hypothetical protein
MVRLAHGLLLAITLGCFIAPGCLCGSSDSAPAEQGSASRPRGKIPPMPQRNVAREAIKPPMLTATPSASAPAP